ncbi:hypothetical protein [Photobacterium iliopiscarium]|uniref:hypothetical protein n=1 Tax=Photobacterium iliopiscarium TaxID=56192 RepID=UPI00399C6833
MLGGLVGEESRNNDTGVPILKEIPLVGSLFGFASDRDQQSVIDIDKGQHHLAFVLKTNIKF